MKHEDAPVGGGQPATPPQSPSTPHVVLDDLPWNPHIYRLLERELPYISGAHIFVHAQAPPGDSKPPPDNLTYEELRREDIPQLEGYRNAELICRRLAQGYICRVAKNSEGTIEQVLWCTDKPYFCWPFRTTIDPGPQGRYIFDVYTPPLARRKGRFVQNFAALRRTLTPDDNPVVSAVNATNRTAVSMHRAVGFCEIARVWCVVILGCKLYRFMIADTKLHRRWLFRPTGSHITFDCVTRKIS